MKRRNTLDAVLQVKGEREREAGRLLAEKRRRLEEHEKRLAELESYRHHYLARLRDATGSGLGIGQLKEYRIFLSRLDQALEQQRRTLQAARQAVEASQAQWLACRKEKKAVDKVAERRGREAEKRARSREQKECDELASRHRWRHMA